MEIVLPTNTRGDFAARNTRGDFAARNTSGDFCGAKYKGDFAARNPVAFCSEKQVVVLKRVADI